MIKGIFIVNNTGKARLIKVYERREFCNSVLHQSFAEGYQSIVDTSPLTALLFFVTSTNSNQYLSLLS